MYIYKRPHLDEFLKKISRFGNVYIFTASIQKYADPIIDIIDPKGIIKKRYYREVNFQNFINIIYLVMCGRQNREYIKEHGHNY